MQRDHTAKADVDELEVLHDESNRALFWADYRVGASLIQGWKYGSLVQPNYGIARSLTQFSHYFGKIPSAFSIRSSFSIVQTNR